jgi:peptide/nickel transport system ATP-binding protein
MPLDQNEDPILLRVRGLTKHFETKRAWRGPKQYVKAVEDISFDVKRRSIVGLVGESGSGKTTAGRALLRLIEPTAGSVEYEGTDLLGLSNSAMLPYRKHLQIIFQDPYSSLNPRMTVEEIVGEALRTHSDLGKSGRRDRTGDLLTRVGLRPDHMTRYPHEFSGGQRQRIGIARALAVEPSFIVADESVSALDVSVQAQVLNLLQDLQEELGLTLLFIAHDLAVVDYLCDEVIVMYLGRIMEMGPTDALLTNPRHPYTRALLSAAPIPDPTLDRTRILLKADIPSPINAPSGCVFRTRCPHAIADCAVAVPPLTEVAPGHVKACIREDLF